MADIDDDEFEVPPIRTRAPFRQCNPLSGFFSRRVQTLVRIAYLMPRTFKLRDLEDLNMKHAGVMRRLTIFAENQVQDSGRSA